MASSCYNRGLTIVSKTNWESGLTLKAALVKSTYTFDKDHHDMADVSANECDVASYARATVANPTATQDDTNDWVKFDLDDVAWPTLESGNTIGGMVIFEDTGAGDGDKDLIVFIDFTNTATNGGSFTVQISSNGAFRLKHAA